MGGRWLAAHVPDIGAFELQGAKVTAVATTAAASAAAGQPIGFSSDGSCIPGRGAPDVSWSFDDGATAAGAAATHSFATAGRHVATVTVSDGDGHQATATAAVDVTAALAAPATPAATRAPVITGLQVAPRRIEIGTLLPKSVAKPARRAGTIGFTLSEPATVELRFARLRGSGKARSVRTRVRVQAEQGANRIRFAARLSRRVALAPGAYRLTAIASTRPGRAQRRCVRASRPSGPAAEPGYCPAACGARSGSTTTCVTGMSSSSRSRSTMPVSSQFDFPGG